MTASSTIDGQRKNIAITTTSYMVHGTILASILLSFLLCQYRDNGGSAILASRYGVIGCGAVYLVICYLLLKREKYKAVNRLLIGFYLFVSLYTLLVWGLDEPIALLTVSFTIFLSGILIGAKAIPPVTIIAILTLISVQLVHTYTTITPYAQSPALFSRELDITAYTIILSVLALICWLSESQREQSLQRALVAESRLRAQKEALSTELQEESSALRLAELSQIREFHKFALLGQSTAAVLHELSNHLSVLNLDIDDLRQQGRNSKAIANAKHSIEHINKMVRGARQQLNTYDEHVRFNAISTINRITGDFRIKYADHHVTVIRHPTVGAKSFSIVGSPLALMQIMTILLTNAFDACRESPRPEITVGAIVTDARLEVTIKDNGPGIDPAVRRSLFNPMTSTKSTGLGVGLYIARHLAEGQFQGSVEAIPNQAGATFVVTIPKKSLSFSA